MYQLKQAGQTPPAALNEITAIETSKVSDGLEIQFNFDLSHLNKAFKHYELENSEELKSFRRAAINKQQ